MNKLRLFFCHSPYQFYLSRTIIGSFGDGWESLIFVEGGRGEDDCDVTVHQIPQTNGNWKKFPWVGGELVKKIKEIIKAYNPQVVEFLFSDLDWPINNYIFFWAVKKGYKISLFEDGSAFYFRSTSNWIKKCKLLLKSAIGVLGFSYYKAPMLSNYLGYDSALVERVYLLRYSDVVDHKKQLIIPFGGECLNSEKSVLLFLDQPWGRVWDIYLIKTVARAIEKYLLDFHLANFRVLIKPHPRDQFFEYSFSKYFQTKFEVLESDKCVEELIISIAPAEVVSFFSTALVNIAGLFKGVRVKSFTLSDIFMRDNLPSTVEIDSLVAYFLDNGVEMFCLDINDEKV